MKCTVHGVGGNLHVHLEAETAQDAAILVSHAINADAQSRRVASTYADDQKVETVINLHRRTFPGFGTQAKTNITP